MSTFLWRKIKFMVIILPYLLVKIGPLEHFLDFFMEDM